MPKFARTDQRKFSFSVRTVDRWNRLPDVIKNRQQTRRTSERDLKVPKCEIFNLMDSRDFYTKKPLWVGEILTLGHLQELKFLSSRGTETRTKTAYKERNTSYS
jgi:hypothetical protein